MAEADAAGEDSASRDTSNQIHDGVYFGWVIQGRNVSLQLPAPVTPALSGLPPASTTFIGRDSHLEALLQGLAPGPQRQEAVLVASVAGLAGVGKTELVVQTAARALEKPGWFPGGGLFVDMFGYDSKRRLSPAQALRGLLHALGIPDEHIPEEQQDRSRLYRSVLAEFARQKRRILVVIDNASSSEQVDPLLPTDGTTAVLLTSRHTLDLGARLHDLDILDEHASVELLRKALFEARDAADTRVSDAPEDAAMIARLCAGLPLALRIAAALLADTPRRPLADLSQALSDVHHRLDQLARESRAVRAALDLSYEQLSEAQARMFRLVALNPGPDLSTAAAAHGAAADQLHTKQLLLELTRAHLVEPGAVWGRWGLHDLVRVYASERAAKEPTTTDDVRRLLRYYLERATRADDYVVNLMEPTPHGFPDRSQAVAWLDAERENLFAAAALAEAMGHHDIARDLPLALENYFSMHGYVEEWRANAALAIRAAQALDDERGAARAGVSLSDALRALNAYAEAISESRKAAEIFRCLGDQSGEGMALRALASALSYSGHYEESLRMSEQAIPLLKRGSNRHFAAVALMDYGAHLTLLKRYNEAIGALQESLAVLSQTSKSVKTLALLNLAHALDGVGRRAEATHSFQECIACALEAGGPWETDIAAKASVFLGNLFSEDEQPVQASLYFRQGAALFKQTGDDTSAAEAFRALGATLIALGENSGEGSDSRLTATAHEGNYEQAADALSEAITLTRRAVENRPDEVAPELADILRNYSTPLVHLGRCDEAQVAAQEALTIVRQLAEQDPHAHQTNLALALDNLAWVLSQDSAQLPAALKASTEAVDIATGLARNDPAEHSELLRYTAELKAGLLGELAQASVCKIAHATMTRAKEELNPTTLEQETGLLPSQIAAGTAWLDAYHRSQELPPGESAESDDGSSK
ncbi:Tetratricopeptide repeat-containing protein [Streptomyces sp. DI166]|uniref:NB-ARC domain-containing protein n=1 Tax=Streptomyces sp. DI166 TaxID=1839783 RepID=UPI0007F4FC67|nr:NB-ARC domain-containing protein [Streptomyces sp. DI166]SBT89329.1 Tetratricopeptide repeat-containing protein [Streptomyces sp. DI166]